MEFHEIVLAVILCAPGLFLIVGSYILQRDRYWTRVWKRLGEPQVESIKELKSLMEKQSQTVGKEVASGWHRLYQR